VKPRSDRHLTHAYTVRQSIRFPSWISRLDHL
jgi:hypothetical protein